MPAAPMPANESERIAALLSYEVLDTACEVAFDNIADFAAKATGSPIALISLTDTHRQWFKARYGTDAAEVSRDLAPCFHAILTPHAPLIVPDTARDPRFADNPLVTGAFAIRFYAGVPLVNPEGFVLGTLCVIDHVPRSFDATQQEALTRLAEMAVTTLELRRALNRLHRLAIADPLTGLANRRAFLDTVERAISRQRRHGEPFSLLYLDLDGFKKVNDIHGHAVGDEVLREVAAVLETNIRREDVAGRLGGDEFAVLLTSAQDARIGERIRATLAARMAERGWPVTASLGFVTFLSPPGSPREALSSADTLMYVAKSAGKNHLCWRDHEGRVISSITA